MGDGRFNMGRSLLVTGAIMGADVRICAPEDAVAGQGRPGRSRTSGPRSPARRITLTADPAEGLRGADFVHTDVWVSMGEPKDVWNDARRGAHAVPGQRRGAWHAPATRGRKFMHCLPAFHDTQHRRRRARSPT